MNQHLQWIMEFEEMPLTLCRAPISDNELTDSSTAPIPRSTYLHHHDIPSQYALQNNCSMVDFIPRIDVYLEVGER